MLVLVLIVLFFCYCAAPGSARAALASAARDREFFGIVALGVLAAATYGIAQDQVTVRVCLEYFTVAHPRIVDSESPTVLAFAWGVLATWWVGLGLGTCLAIAARVGPRPKVAARTLVRPVAILIAIIACSALVAGLSGYALSRAGAIALGEPLASRIAVGQHAGFMANWWAHASAYIVGVAGAMVLVVQTRRRR